LWRPNTLRSPAVKSELEKREGIDNRGNKLREFFESKNYADVKKMRVTLSAVYSGRHKRWKSDDDRMPCIYPILVQLISTAADGTSLVLHSVWALLIWPNHR